MVFERIKMGTADKIRELIEQTATIKANFHLENSLSFSSYDWRKREKKNCFKKDKIAGIICWVQR